MYTLLEWKALATGSIHDKITMRTRGASKKQVRVRWYVQVGLRCEHRMKGEEGWKGARAVHSSSSPSIVLHSALCD
jgi:hypothetical protein